MSLELKRMKCVTTSPFTVTIDGGSTAVPALLMAGSSFSINDVGWAMWSPPAKPICFKAT